VLLELGCVANVMNSLCVYLSRSARATDLSECIDRSTAAKNAAVSSPVDEPNADDEDAGVRLAALAMACS